MSATDGAPEMAVVPAALPNTEEKRSEVIRRIFGLMGPTVIGSILAFSTQAITNSFVGRRLGAELFAHYTLGVSVANLFGFSVGIGLNGALDTFISQAFGRDKQATRDIGVSLQRACVLSLIACVPLAAVLLWGGPLFRLLFGDELGDGALEFTQHAVPNLILYFGTNILTKVVQAINLPELVVYCAGLSAVSCFFINYFLTYSIATAVLTLSLTYFIQLVALVCLIRFHPKITFWRHCEWPSKDSYSPAGMRQFLEVGIPSMIAVCAEWWAFEVLDIVAASISVHDVAAVNLVLTIGSLYFSVALSIAVASSVLVGNALGENRPALARQFAINGLLIAQVINFVDTAALIFFRREIAGLFTHDERLTETFCDMIFVIAAYIWGDSVQFCLQSIFRSTGQQRTAAKVVLVSLWAVGLPLSVVFGRWMEMGAKGVVLGLVCGFVIEIPLMLRYLATWPWDKLAEQASKRLDSEMHPEGEPKTIEEGEGSTMDAAHPEADGGAAADAEAAAREAEGTLEDKAARQCVAAVIAGGFGAHVHITPPLTYARPPCAISPRHIEADDDLSNRCRTPAVSRPSSRPVSRMRGESMTMRGDAPPALSLAPLATRPLVAMPPPQ